MVKKFLYRYRHLELCGMALTNRRKLDRLQSSPFHLAILLDVFTNQILPEQLLELETMFLSWHHPLVISHNWDCELS